MEQVGINRNIMECKDELLLSIVLPRIGINRNIMECKDRWEVIK